MRKLSLQELNRASAEAFKAQQKTPFVLVLDNIRSALNVGSAFRTADGFALEKIVLCGITAQPPHREILKTAIGATETVQWQHFEQTTEALLTLRQEGYLLIGIEQTDKSILLSNFVLNPDKKYALVFGNEVKGLEEDALPLLDECLEIPQLGTKHSLNVSVCVGIIVWELFRQFNQ